MFGTKSPIFILRGYSMTYLKTNTALMTAILLSTALSAAPAFAQIQSQTITQNTTMTVKPISINNKTKEIKPAVQHFVELVNNARVDIATKQTQDAVAKINEAQNFAAFIKQNSSVEEITHETRIASGKVMYSTESTSGAYYVPFETGPVKLKTVEETPSDKANATGLAVASAEVVYLTVDLSGNEAETYLSGAKMDLEQGKTAEADKKLAELMSKVVIAETTDSLPYEKARDNLDLALKFLQDGNNYTAARYALGHSIEALKSMSTDARYKSKESATEADRVKQIHDLLLQENTAAAEKARTEIKAAQDEVSKLKS